jgi:hypothetical protein
MERDGEGEEGAIMPKLMFSMEQIRKETEFLNNRLRICQLPAWFRPGKAIWDRRRKEFLFINRYSENWNDEHINVTFSVVPRWEFELMEMVKREDFIHFEPANMQDDGSMEIERRDNVKNWLQKLLPGKGTT